MPGHLAFPLCYHQKVTAQLVPIQQQSAACMLCTWAAGQGADGPGAQLDCPSLGMLCESPIQQLPLIAQVSSMIDSTDEGERQSLTRSNLACGNFPCNLLSCRPGCAVWQLSCRPGCAVWQLSCRPGCAVWQLSCRPGCAVWQLSCRPGCAVWQLSCRPGCAVWQLSCRPGCAVWQHAQHEVATVCCVAACRVEAWWAMLHAVLCFC
jgi:hypothetical protein